MVSFFSSIILAFSMLISVMSGSAFSGDNFIEKHANQYFQEHGVIGYLYDTDNQYFYTADSAWQGAFGYNNSYDYAAPFVVIYYDTDTFNFNYGGKDWRIQLWKGQYGWIFIGAEIGVYTKPADRAVEHYDIAKQEDWLGMSFKLNRFGLLNLFETKYKQGWWCTGFVPGNLILMNWSDQLTMQVRITMKDEGMQQVFCKCLSDKGIRYQTEGLDVYFNY